MTPEQMQARINELEEICDSLEIYSDNLQKLLLQKQNKISDLQAQIEKLKEAA